MNSYGVTQTRRTLARPIGFVKDFLGVGGAGADQRYDR
jgi:hypothetical protein